MDIVPFLVDGREQVITVRLDSREKLNQPPFGSVTESLTYGGIYRDVYLDVKDEYYIEDIYTATSDVRTDEKILKAQIKLNAYTEGLRLAAHLDTWTENVKRISVADVKAAMNRKLSADKMVTVVVGE